MGRSVGMPVGLSVGAFVVPSLEVTVSEVLDVTSGVYGNKLLYHKMIL